MGLTTLQTHLCTPEFELMDFDARQKYRIIQLGEKTSLADALEPLAQSYGTELILPTGEITDTLLFEMVEPSAFAVSRLGEGQSRSALPL